MAVEIVLHTIELAGIAFLVGAKYWPKRALSLDHDVPLNSGITYASGQHITCKVCHRTVARYNAEGVCLNCAPES